MTSEAGVSTLPGPILEVAGVSLSFKALAALTDVGLSVRRGEICAIIGPNGAGKSSLLNVINGVYRAQAGTLTFEGVERPFMKPRDAALAGVARTFQNIALFKGMSVLDNVMTGRTLKSKAGFFSQALYVGAGLRSEIAEREAVERILEFLEVQAHRHAIVRTLPYGLQKRVELARALAAEPKLLLLDEPMAGMTFEEKEDMCRFIVDANDALGTTVVLIEHDMGVVMGISDHVVVLDYGQKIADGTPDFIRTNQAVIDAYLGVAA